MCVWVAHCKRISGFIGSCCQQHCNAMWLAWKCEGLGHLSKLSSIYLCICFLFFSLVGHRDVQEYYWEFRFKADVLDWQLYIFPLTCKGLKEKARSCVKMKRLYEKTYMSTSKALLTWCWQASKRWITGQEKIFLLIIVTKKKKARTES